MEKLSELSAQIICLNDELSNLKYRFVQTSKERDELENKVSLLKSDLDRISRENLELKNTSDDVQRQLDVANKVCAATVLVMIKIFYNCVV